MSTSEASFTHSHIKALTSSANPRNLRLEIESIIRTFLCKTKPILRLRSGQVFNV